MRDLVRGAIGVVALAVAVGAGAQGGAVSFGRLSFEQGLSQSIVEGILQDRSGFMWFVTEDGLNRFDGYNFTVFKHEAGNPNSLGHNELKALYEDRDGVLWVATDRGGLSCVDPAEGAFSTFQHDPSNPLTLSADRVLSLYQDRSQVLWIGTYGGGLNSFDRASGTFHCFTTADGLANDSVCGILEDREGGLWVSTNSGLPRFDPGTESFRNYDVHDGLQSNEFNGVAFFASPSGELFFGGINGLNAFFPERIRPNPEPPPEPLC